MQTQVSARVPLGRRRAKYSRESALLMMARSFRLLRPMRGVPKCQRAKSARSFSVHPALRALWSF